MLDGRCGSATFASVNSQQVNNAASSQYFFYGLARLARTCGCDRILTKTNRRRSPNACGVFVLRPWPTHKKTHDHRA